MAAASTKRSSNGPVRSVSPSGRFYNSHYTSSPSCSSSSFAFAYSSSSFSPRSSTFPRRFASPTRVNPYPNNNPSHSSSAHSVGIVSPNRSTIQVQVLKNQNHMKPKRTCMCSTTTHPGSFRCSLHKNFKSSQPATNYRPINPLDARRSAMTKSLVRIGGVEGDLVKRALSALIRSSSHQQRRRAGFQRLPSRLSIVSS